jgi:hypothetical protein
MAGFQISTEAQNMHLFEMIEKLKTERDVIDEAILAFERLALGRQGPRRGRPPRWIQSSATPVKKRRINRTPKVR